MKQVLFLCGWIVCTQALQAEPRFDWPTELRIGSMAEALVWDSVSPGPVKWEVLNDKQEILFTAKSFPLDSDQGFQVEGAFLALDVLIPAGQGQIRALDSSGKILSEGNVTFLLPAFPTEKIVLDREMSELRQKPDAQKDREAEEIWRIYLTFRPQDLFTSGKFEYPVDPKTRISGAFGVLWQYLFADGTTARDYHKGTDFACAPGTEVRAPAAGLVVLVKNRIVTGGTVVIEHAPGLYSIYFHLSHLTARVGERVGVGQLLGLSGATGLVTGPHLHWEVRCGGVSVDALDLVRGGLLDKERIDAVVSTIEQKKGVMNIAVIQLDENEVLEKAIKRFKRMVEKEGIIREWKKREYFEKPSTINNRKKKALVRKQLKKLRKVQTSTRG